MKPTHIKIKVLLTLLCCSAYLFNSSKSCAQTLPTLQQQNTSQSPSLLQESKEGLWLVEAKCFSVNAATNAADWRVTAVFNGPQSLLNSTFASSLLQPHFAGADTALSFTPAPGDDVIWTVQFIDGTLERGANTFIHKGGQSRLAYGVSFPIGRNHPEPTSPAIYSNFEQALSLAQSVKRVAEVIPEEQVTLLTSYTKSSLRELSAWAVFTLAESNAPTVPKLLQDLLNDTQVPVQGQIAVSESLLLLDDAEKTWRRSQKRLDFLKRIVTSQANKEDADSINSYLSGVAREENLAHSVSLRNKQPYRSSVDGAKLFDLLQWASANTQWPVSSRVVAARNVRELVVSGQIPRSLAWQYWLALLKNHPDFAASPSVNKAADVQLALGALLELSNLQPHANDEATEFQNIKQQARSKDLKFLFDLPPVE